LEPTDDLALTDGLGGARAAAEASQVTFSKDVLPILQKNCQACHRPSGQNMSGMIAPMSFMTYEEVRPWSKAIVKAITEKKMPPWDASEKFHGVFRNERTLSAEQIQTLTDWVNQGAKRGNPQDAPAPMTFPDTGWNFGKPDLVVDFPQPFFVKDEVQDLYQNITTQLTAAQMPTDRWIRSVEFKPGSEVVHHIIGHANDKEHAGDTSRGMLGGNAPGADQSEWDKGYGMLLKKESAITFAMHYHKEAGPGTGKYDSSQIGFQFHPEGEKVTHPVTIFPIGNGLFEIPPNKPRWMVGASHTFTEDTFCALDAAAHAPARHGGEVHGVLSGRHVGAAAGCSAVGLQLADGLRLQDHEGTPGGYPRGNGVLVR